MSFNHFSFSTCKANLQPFELLLQLNYSFLKEFMCPSFLPNNSNNQSPLPRNNHHQQTQTKIITSELFAEKGEIWNLLDIGIQKTQVEEFSVIFISYSLNNTVMKWKYFFAWAMKRLPWQINSRKAQVCFSETL